MRSEGVLVLNIAETVAHARVEHKKARFAYKKHFDSRPLRGNATIKVGYHVLLNVQDGKAKYKLRGHTEVPLPVLNRITWTFVIHCGDVVEPVTSDGVGRHPPVQ